MTLIVDADRRFLPQKFRFVGYNPERE